MAEILPKLLGITLIIFMSGNLLEVGLKLNLRDAMRAMGDARFVVLSVLWSFILCPALAYAIAKIVPMAEPYAVGLLFLGMAPCAPFLPLVSQKARGDLAYVAAFILITAVGTVILMPFMVGLLVRGFATDPWAIARPLIFYIAAPLVVGIMIRIGAEAFAEKSHPVIRTITLIDTLVMIVCIVILYAGDFAGAVGTNAIAAQILFFVLAATGPYAIGLGLSHPKKSVLALGVCTRNIGAAIAPLFAGPETDRRAIAMCALAVPITVIGALIVAIVFARLAPTAERPETAPGGTP